MLARYMQNAVWGGEGRIARKGLLAMTGDEWLWAVQSCIAHTPSVAHV
ncbi:hypothetical protein ALO54_102390 [Pseudomonas syringae pv. philadelphi]|nr:hypothetical protein ALO86_102133 [Pseudomonas syringae pv. berberidis]KPY14104.1 hypothetical protein ALO54_102390 [Pseudomonas syringae pv. philadelphi]RMM36583.1 hypothetical protein ALQ83_102463 [Pseudomonas syringae pv. berberidis]RMP69147.1 hypothetical protein ALQ19_102445 [Pseudomonas syringae pv. berberidis]RMQ30936.1 hypothetical protein ALQ06_102364 [Pseudomonas syringae pv. berberidis]